MQLQVKAGLYDGTIRTGRSTGRSDAKQSHGGLLSLQSSQLQFSWGLDTTDDAKLFEVEPSEVKCV